MANAKIRKKVARIRVSKKEEEKNRLRTKIAHRIFVKIQKLEAKTRKEYEKNKLGNFQNFWLNHLVSYLGEFVDYEVQEGIRDF